MASRPMLSIVTPVFNGAAHLTKAISSVREAAALGASIEHIIVDGGSTDGSLELAHAERARAGSPISGILTGPDSGQSQAINRGVEAAEGEFVVWLNADDYYLPTGLAQIVSALSRTTADVVVGRCRFVDEAGRSLFVPRAPDPVTAESMLRLLTGWFAGRSIVQPEAFVRADTWRRVGGLAETLHYTMDYHLWLRLSGAGAVFEHAPIDVARQLVHAGQKTSNNSAVVGELLSYAPTFLRTLEPSPERDQASEELERIRLRLTRAERVLVAIDAYESRPPGIAMVPLHARGLDGSALDTLRQRSPGRPVVLLAGLHQREIALLRHELAPALPLTVVGRLPAVLSVFDVVVAGADAFPPGTGRFDPRDLLRPGGVLCLLGVINGTRSTRGELRKRLGDMLTLNERVMLDSGDAELFAGKIREMCRSIRSVGLERPSDAVFCAHASTAHDEMHAINARFGLRAQGPTLGTLILSRS